MLPLFALLALTTAVHGATPALSQMTELYRAWWKTGQVNFYSGYKWKLDRVLALGYKQLPHIGYIGMESQAAALKAACPQIVPLRRQPYPKGQTYYSLHADGSGKTVEGYVVRWPICGASVKVIEYKSKRSEDRIYVAENSAQHEHSKRNGDFRLVGPAFYIWSFADLSRTSTKLKTTTSTTTVRTTTTSPVCLECEKNFFYDVNFCPASVPNADCSAVPADAALKYDSNSGCLKAAFMCPADSKVSISAGGNSFVQNSNDFEAQQPEILCSKGREWMLSLPGRPSAKIERMVCYYEGVPPSVCSACPNPINAGGCATLPCAPTSDMVLEQTGCTTIATCIGSPKQQVTIPSVLSTPLPIGNPVTLTCGLEGAWRNGKRFFRGGLYCS